MLSSKVKRGPRVWKQCARRRAPVRVRRAPVRKVGVRAVREVIEVVGSEVREVGIRVRRRGWARAGGQ